MSIRRAARAVRPTPAVRTLFPAVSPESGRTLFRMVLRMGRGTRTLERWHDDQAQADGAAAAVLADWGGRGRDRVLHVYPVPMGVVHTATGIELRTVGGP